jgi:hypothetical protein
MPSVTIRPALVGKFAIVLEEVATAQGISTAAVLRQLMTEAWGPNLENAPTTPAGMTAIPDRHTRQASPSNPVAIPVHPTGTARPPNPAPDDLFAQSA